MEETEESIVSKKRYYLKKADPHCSLHLAKCTREYCRYFNLVTGCRYERMHGIEERIQAGVDLVRIDGAALKGQSE